MTFLRYQKGRKNIGAQPGFEPGTTCTQSRYHTPRPLSHCSLKYPQTLIKLSEEKNICDTVTLKRVLFINSTKEEGKWNIEEKRSLRIPSKLDFSTF